MHIGMNKSKDLKIVIDANWYISACISRKSRRTLYYSIFKNPGFQVYYADALMTEFSQVIERPKFSKILTQKQVNRFKLIALGFLQKVKIDNIPELVRDVDDNYLLAICESCHADYLITGDQDLLVLLSYQNTKIVTMGQFFQVVNA